MDKSAFTDLVDELIGHAAEYRDAKIGWKRWEKRLEELKQQIIREWQLASDSKKTSDISNGKS